MPISSKCTCQYHRSNCRNQFSISHFYHRSICRVEPHRHLRRRIVESINYFGYCNLKGCVHPRGSSSKDQALLVAWQEEYAPCPDSLSSRFWSCSLAPNPRGWPFQSMSSRRFAYPRVLQFLKLLSSKDQTLLVRRNAFRILDLCLHVFDCVTWLRIEVDGLRNQLWAVAMHQLLIIHEGIAGIVVLWHRNCWIKPRGKILTWWV